MNLNPINGIFLFMNNIFYKKAVETYINAYNNFDVEGMLSQMHPEIKFENISNGQITLTTNGIEELKNQALQAKELFKERKQTALNMVIRENEVEVEIDYFGILAQDLPNGMKADDKIELKGKSIFKFKEDKFIELKDIS